MYYINYLDWYSDSVKIAYGWETNCLSFCVYVYMNRENWTATLLLNQQTIC